MLVKTFIQLPKKLLNRPIRPFHLALMISTVTIGAQIFNACDCGLNRPPTQLVLSIVAVFASLFLLLGWIIYPDRKRSIWFSSWGAILALGLWTTRGTYVVLSDEGSGIVQSPAISGALSVAWILVSLGVWMIEQLERDLLRMRGEGE